MSDHFPDNLRRSLLFVPGAEPRKIESARSAGADTLIFDLEDAVAPERKPEARECVASALRGGGFGAAELAVRVNAWGTPDFEADVQAVVRAGARALLLPKCEGVESLVAAAASIDLAADGAASVAILALVETARGVVAAPTLSAGHRRVAALCFGHADFALDMGLVEADAQHGVLLHARCTVAIAAKASGCVPIDSVFLAVRDEPGFRVDAMLGASLGYEGKLCIHPNQVRIANDVYTPTRQQAEYAQMVLVAWEEARARGQGVFTLGNKMIDAPIVALQQRILARAQRAGVA